MSLKYLLPALQSRPGSVGMPDNEFERLLLDVQVGRTNNRSTEEFVESLERIINELKAHTAEAEPFLKPVSKKIAPDYDQVITKPMDLTTLLKNVKNRMYKTKKSFARDLNLIWSNCLTYNSVEGHPLRQQALFMKRLADHHLSYLADRATEIAPLPTFLSAHSLNGTAFRQGRSASTSEKAGNLLTTPTATHAQLDGLAARAENTDEGRENATQEENHPPSSPEPTGVPYKSFPNDISNTPAIIRTQQSMQAYQALLEKDTTDISAEQVSQDRPDVPSWFPQEQTRGNGSGSGSRQASPFEDDDQGQRRREDEALGLWWGEFSQPEWIGSGFPITLQEAASEASTLGEKSMDKARRKWKHRQSKRLTRDPDMAGGLLQDGIARNIENISKLRVEAQRLSSHVAALNDESLPPPVLPDSALDEGYSAEELLVRSRSRRHVDETITEEVAGHQMRITISALMAQNGFSGKSRRASKYDNKLIGCIRMSSHSPGCSQLALDSINQLAGRYLRHLGRTFRLLMDRNDPKIGPEDMIRLVIRENGNFTPEILSSYITDEVFKQAQRVEDSLSKVRQAMAMQPELETVEEEVDDKDMAFGIPGMEDVGDFLGIPGIPAIPRKLLRAPAAARESDKVKSDAPVLEYHPPPPFVPLTAADIPHQIGLLRSFYLDKLGDAAELPEEDFDPNLPSMGAMGQIVIKTVSAATKRKAEAAAATSGSTDANKKKSKFLPAAKT